MHTNYWAEKKLNWKGYEETLLSTDVSCFIRIQAWQEEILTWYNRQIIAMKKNMIPHPKQLFIWGPSRCGKSMMVDKLCSNSRAIYKPTNTKFPFGSFDPLLHKLIKFENFDLKRNMMSMDQLLSLLEGAEFSADRKHRDHFTIRVKIPIIFISNFPPDLDNPDPVVNAFFNRFSIVEANTPIELVDSAMKVHQLNDLKTPHECDLMSFRFSEMLEMQKSKNASAASDISADVDADDGVEQPASNHGGVVREAVPLDELVVGVDDEAHKLRVINELFEDDAPSHESTRIGGLLVDDGGTNDGAGDGMTKLQEELEELGAWGGSWTEIKPAEGDQEIVGVVEKYRQPESVAVANCFNGKFRVKTALSYCLKHI